MDCKTYDGVGCLCCSPTSLEISMTFYPRPRPLAVGDVVRLKSGGPKMTVRKVDGDLCGVNRFQGDLFYHVFPSACLVRVE